MLVSTPGCRKIFRFRDQGGGVVKPFRRFAGPEFGALRWWAGSGPAGMMERGASTDERART
jgi:hypothetical protein